MESVGLGRGYVVQLHDGDLAVVLSVQEAVAIVSRTAASEDSEKVSTMEITVVFPTKELLAKALRRSADLSEHGDQDPRWTNDRAQVGALADAALDVEFAWPNGRQIYELVYSLYRGIRKSNFQEHGPYNA